MTIIRFKDVLETAKEKGAELLSVGLVDNTGVTGWFEVKAVAVGKANADDGNHFIIYLSEPNEENIHISSQIGEILEAINEGNLQTEVPINSQVWWGDAEEKTQDYLPFAYDILGDRIIFTLRENAKLTPIERALMVYVGGDVTTEDLQKVALRS